METAITASAAVALGLAALVWGADRFVSGSAGLARQLGISPLIIGLTIVSLGTSAPEIIISISSALRGVGELAVGNAIGSNIANIGLVLGFTALIAPLPTQRHLLTQEAPILLLLTAWAGITLYNGHLGRGESLAMLAGLPVLLWLTVRLKRQRTPEELAKELEQVPNIAAPAALAWFFVGLALMLAGAEATVWGATILATLLGVSELVVGLTVVAIGTSLPELAASVTSALRGHHGIAIGNIFGSNLFNLMAVLPIAGAIQPLALGTEVFIRDYLALAALTLLLCLGVAVARRRRRGPGHHLSRAMGASFLALYLGYYLVLYHTG